MKERVVLGIDIGGTNTVFGFVTERGKCLKEFSFKTLAEKPVEDFFNRLENAVRTQWAPLDAAYEMVGIGIGAPNGNYYRGTIEDPPNLSWKNVHVIETLSKRFDLPMAITNDANAAALGEMHFGLAKGMKDFVVITLGTGVGSGLVVNGSLVYGADGFAGELGHTIVVPNGRVCGCGRKGCLEAYLSARGLRQTAKEILELSPLQSELRRLPEGTMGAKKIADAAQNGDQLAIEIYRKSGEMLGFKLADTVAHLSPEAIFLFGGLAKSGDLLLTPVRKALEENLLSIYRGKVKVLLSGLSDVNAAVLGSAALIWEELERHPAEGR